MKARNTLVTLLVAALAMTAAAAPAKKKAADKKTVKKVVKKQLPLLSMQAFIRTAVANSPSLAALRYGYRENISQAKRIKAIKDIMLEAKANYSAAKMLTSDGMPTGTTNVSAFGTELSLGKKFPGLLGMRAGLSLSFNRSSFDKGAPFIGAKSTTPVVGLQLTFPLLRNMFGELDRNKLKDSSLKIKMVKKMEKEAVEEFVQSLVNAYIDWSLLSRKTAIYRGITARAYGLYAQTLRKRRVGLADWSDVYLVNANYLRYRSLLLSAQLQEEQQYINLIAMMQGKRPGKKIPGKITIRYRAEKIVPKIQMKKIELNKLRTIQLAALSYKQSVLSHQIARSDQKPSLNLILSGGANGNTTEFGGTSSETKFPQGQFYAGLEFSMFLQNRDKKNETASKKAARNKAAMDYRNALKETSYALTNLKNSITRMVQLHKLSKTMAAVNRNRGYYMLRKYTQGRVALSQVTDARDGYANAVISQLEQEASLQKLYLSYLALTDDLLKEIPVTLRKLRH